MNAPTPATDAELNGMSFREIMRATHAESDAEIKAILSRLEAAERERDEARQFHAHATIQWEAERGKTEAAERERDRALHAVADMADVVVNLKRERDELAKALEPFANPPLYVLEGDSAFVPAKMPEDWIGGGWFSSADFRRACAILSRIKAKEPSDGS